MKIKNKCLRCDVQVPRGLKFCNGCARAISAAHDNVLERAHAAGSYLRNVQPEYNGRNGEAQQKHDRLVMAAFLSVFHPEMSPNKADRIANESIA